MAKISIKSAISKRGAVDFTLTLGVTPEIST